MQHETPSFWTDIKEYEERLSREPDSFVFANLSQVYLKVGLVDDALHVARQGVHRHPRYIAGQRALALACHAKGLQGECRQALENIAAALPEDRDNQKMLGRLLAAEGDLEGARKSFKTVLEFYRDDLEAKVEFEAIARNLPQTPGSFRDGMDAEFAPFDDAEEILEDIEILDIEEIDILDEYEDEELEAADLDTPAEIHDPLSTVTLAGLYVQQGFLQKALDIYRALIVDNPTNGDIKDRIEELEARMASGSTGEVTSHVVPSAAMFVHADPEPAASPDSTASSRHAGVIAVLEGWLVSIRRIKACR